MGSLGNSQRCGVEVTQGAVANDAKPAVRRLAADRRRRIASMVRERGSVRASELSHLFGVTDETIRRDLVHLAEGGELKRLHGGAIAEQARTETSFARRIREHEAEKAAIAEAAADLVADGSTIILDSGSTTLHLARALVKRRDLVVITNAVTNAIELMENPNIVVVLTGGTVRRTTFGATGELAVTNLAGLHVDQTFLAITGVSIDGGLTYPSFEEAAVKRAMVAAAAEVVLLADHTKFGRNTMVQVAPLDVLSRIVTNAPVDEPMRGHLQDLGVEVTVASSGRPDTRARHDGPVPGSPMTEAGDGSVRTPMAPAER